jgi:hypothetical protein
MKRDARTIKELREAITALVLAYDAWVRINADGKRTVQELLGLFTLVPAAWDALKDSGDILAEFKDLDGFEADELIGFVAAKLNWQIETAEMRLKIDKVLIAAHAIADANAQWFGINPPRAQIVP